MLPARRDDRPSLAAVLASCLDAVLGASGPLELPAVDHALVVLVDGLGSHSLTARSAHARMLSRASGRSIESGFPSTTAVALASLTTGTLPGEHGIVGYTALDPAHDRVVNQLSGWDEGMPPESWQQVPTLFERARASGLDAVVIGPSRYEHSGFTRAVLRGARYLGARTIDDRVDAAIAWLRSGTRGIGYLYVPELDAIAHAKGWQSEEWAARLEDTDGALARLAAALARRDGALVTADHGVIDLPPSSLLSLPDHPELLRGVAHVAGEPRCLQLHTAPGVDPAEVASRWQAAEGARSWIATREEMIEAGWFGTVEARVLHRLGDVFVAARKGIAYYAHGTATPMVGHHGSLSTEELRVPLIGLGAFA